MSSLFRDASLNIMIKNWPRLVHYLLIHYKNKDYIPSRWLAVLECIYCSWSFKRSHIKQQYIHRLSHYFDCHWATRAARKRSLLDAHAQQQIQTRLNVTFNNLVPGLISLTGGLWTDMGIWKICGASTLFSSFKIAFKVS